MPVIHERFRNLAGDVAGLPPPAAPEVRRTAERRRLRGRLLTMATGLAIVFASASVLGQPPNEDERVNASTPTTNVPGPGRPWLPEPWVLVASDTVT